MARGSKSVKSEPAQNRLETGLVKLANDWRGVFLRGPEAMWNGLKLSQLHDQMLAGRKDTELAFTERQYLEVLRTLRDLFLAVDEHKPTKLPVQCLRSYEECQPSARMSATKDEKND